METIEEIKQALRNPALVPSYRQVLEKRLCELESKPGQMSDVPKAEKPTPYRGVAQMTLDEIISFFSQRGFHRLDTPITGLEALQTRYRLAGVLGYDRATVERIAAAIERLGGELPEMEHIDISHLLPDKES